MSDKKKDLEKKASSMLKKNTKPEKDISLNIVQKIKEEHITQKPKVLFQTKNVLLWILLIIAIVVASVATGTLIYASFNLQYYFFSDLPFYHKLRLISVGVPVFWLAILVLAFIIAIKCFRSTKRGYKIPSIILVLLTVLSLFVIGITLFIGGIVERYDSDGDYPNFVHIRPRHEELWMQPVEGLIGGEIIHIEENQLAVILLNNEEWIIDISNATRHQSIHGLELGQFIRALGTVHEEHIFVAKKIFPTFGLRLNEKPRLHPMHRRRMCPACRIDKRKGRYDDRYDNDDDYDNDVDDDWYDNDNNVDDDWYDNDDNDDDN